MTWPAESVTGGLTLLMMKKKPSLQITEGTYRKNIVLETSFDDFVNVNMFQIVTMSKFVLAFKMTVFSRKTTKQNICQWINYLNLKILSPAQTCS